MYFTDRGIDELADRRGQDTVSLAWLAAQFQAFASQHPGFGPAVHQLASWLADMDDAGDARPG